MTHQPTSTPVLHAVLAEKINFACHQNAFSILHELRIQNTDAEQALTGLTLHLESSPAFLKPKVWTIDCLAAGQTRTLDDRDLTLDGGFLLELREAVRGTVTLRLMQGERLLTEEKLLTKEKLLTEENLLAEIQRPVELLAANEWGGVSVMPELLAAFVTPNDPAVDRLLGRASQILQKAGHSGSLDGYTSQNPKRTWLLASAVYSALTSLRVSYALPPASFERTGQKIRLPSQIETSKVATCLDTTLLFAAAFEQAGLNPIVVFTEGHALVGLWLQDDELPQTLIDNAENLRQRLPLNELILIETTYAVQHPALPFSKAVENGARQIGMNQDSRFIAALDIRRARAHRIMPIQLELPRRVSVMDTLQQPKTDTSLDLPPSDLHIPAETTAQPARATQHPKAAHHEKTSHDDSNAHSNGNRHTAQLEDDDDFHKPAPEAEELPTTPSARLDRWKRKLLDLSARNPLLNHKIGKSSLTFVQCDPSALEDLLAKDHAITIEPFPKLQTQGQDEAIYQQRSGEDLKKLYAERALAKKQVLVDLPREELEKIATEIYRKAQTSLSESGSNTLFLAAGFLYWKPREQENKRFRAPLILIPVTLQRKSVRSGIKMLSNEDETRFNTTLLELLKKDFLIDIPDLNGPLPQDDNGVDVKAVWNTVRQAIKNVPGFEVVEEVALGHFSFAKYLMWKDLVDRTDLLKKSPVVKHLMETPRDPFESHIRFVEPQDIDRQYRPADLLTPLPADASQMSAIATADAGKNFVVIGPPGTGKSQTISNMIAHLLGTGKKVLFVSEKTAALEVVHRRLKNIGLGEFCLELHSNKAKKLDVIQQLRGAWESATQLSVTQWQEESNRLQQLRDQLNLTVDALHQTRRNGLTAHYAIGVKVRDETLLTGEQFQNPIRLTWPSADAHDPQQLQQLRDAVDALKVQALSVGNLQQHPLQAVAHTEWGPQWQEQLTQGANQLALTAAELDQSRQALEQALNVQLTKAASSLPHFAALADLCRALLASYRTQAAFALEPDATDRLDALETAVGLLKQYIHTQTQLSCTYPAQAWKKVDLTALNQRWQDAQNSWLVKKFFGSRHVVNTLRSIGAQGKPDPERDLPLLQQLHTLGTQLERLDGQLTGLRAWSLYDTQPTQLESLQSLGNQVRAAVSKLADDADTLANVRSRLRTLMYDANDLLAPDASLGRALQHYVQVYDAFERTKTHLEGLSAAPIEPHLPSTQPVLNAVQTLCQNLIQNQNALREWCGWSKRRQEAVALQLAPLVAALEHGELAPAQLNDVFEAAYCTWWSAAIIEADPILRAFSPPEHSAAIERFRELDDQFSALTARYIFAKLASAIPAADDVRRTSSWGILRHEIQKKMRHKPVRQLMEEIPDVMTTLAPCLMMSPLSIAQFLPAGQSLFDVVIFDEASQITVWDAIGCLARGHQIIVAGDPKQMPPTNFFARADNDEDEVEEADLESILDELIGASIPQRVLNLHYRSRKESLIAFSNSRYYDSSLVTFPAPFHPDRGVSLIRPNGFYARGKGRHNLGEAEAIVAEILRRLRSEDPEVRQQTLGVVTFNTEQQSLIEDLLDQARADDPSIEWAFAEDQTEPVFVKNLETVQGDERDVILFSITYGPDETGHMTMNFGPLNRAGGERRLNVALTRARSEMVIVSTLTPDRINLSRTGAKAVADLKQFLEYAERGPTVLGAALLDPQTHKSAPFETAVANALTEKGWTLHTNVGVSAYRIDLGIVHPDKPGVYLAGIECDGDMYHSSANARERDKIRQQVLRGLGWTLLRAWSPDWWTNRTKAADQLHAQLLQQLEESKKVF